MSGLVKKGISTLGALIITAISIFAQSTDQNFPTPIRSNEITGQIKARDVGDSRLTRYYYAFDGGQGDIFVNVVTKNFAGDIDVFTAETQRPLTKMVIYPDSSASETGRLIYLRKGERLLLRVEGRTPNDDAATFRIKFGGSFIAINGGKEEEAPSLQNSQSATGIRVNSVGTIVEALPNKSEKAPALIPPSVPVRTTATKTEQRASEKPKLETEKKSEKPQVIVTEAPSVSTVFNSKTVTATDRKATEPKSQPAKTPPPKRTTKTKQGVEAPTEPKVDPMANIRLIVQLKTGEVVERPMSEVQRFAWDKGILVVVGKDGKTSRYSIFDVAKVTIE